MSRVRFILAAAAVALLAAACSSNGGTAGPTVSPAVHSTAPASPAAQSSPASALTGKWSGQYSGAYRGTFALHWHQKGSKLSGGITISAPPGSFPIHGVVNGNDITFGTVGSLAITYSGTVSGNSMSGTYQVHGANGSVGGPWSATKTS